MSDVGQTPVVAMYFPVAMCHHVSPAAKNLPPDVAAKVAATSKAPKRTGKETALRKAGRPQAPSVEPASSEAEEVFTLVNH